VYPWQNRRNDLVIPAGALRNQISIQALSTSQDPDTGEPSSTWNTLLTTLTMIATTSSREMYQTGTAA
jgi:head-tail adaptor